MGEVGWVGLRGPDVLTGETLSPVDPVVAVGAGLRTTFYCGSPLHHGQSNAY